MGNVNFYINYKLNLKFWIKQAYLWKKVKKSNEVGI